jgi:hypothetical protein
MQEIDEILATGLPICKSHKVFQWITNFYIERYRRSSCISTGDSGCPGKRTDQQSVFMLPKASQQSQSLVTKRKAWDENLLRSRSKPG